MAVLTYSEMETLFKKRAQIDVSTDAPLAAADLQSFIDDAYADIWEASGGSMKRVSHATAWNDATTANGVLIGQLADVNEIMHLFATTTAPQTLSCTTTSNQSVASSFLFGSVTPGMAVTGANIPTGTYVIGVASTSSLTISANATTSTTLNLTFTPLTSSNEVKRVERSYIINKRGASGAGSYTIPQVYSVTRMATSTAADIGKLWLDYWPGTSGYYFPMHYQAQFTPLAGSGSPDVNDVESRDIALLAAARAVPLLGKSHLRESILADLSMRTAERLQRKIASMLSADQNDAVRA